MTYEKPQYCAGGTVRLIVTGSRAPLDDAKWCARFLSNLCGHIGMTPLAPIQIGELNDPETPKLNGISCVQMIKESHIAIHTWPAWSAARIVVDSCKDFVLRDVIDFIGKHVQPDKVEGSVLGAAFTWHFEP